MRTMREGPSPQESPADARRSRVLATIPALALVVYGLLALFAWHDEEWRPDWDCATYVLTGKALAEGEGYTYLGRPFFLRPPGIAWIIDPSR